MKDEELTISSYLLGVKYNTRLAFDEKTLKVSSGAELKTPNVKSIPDTRTYDQTVSRPLYRFRICANWPRYVI